MTSITPEDDLHKNINKVLDYRDELAEKVVYINIKDKHKYGPKHPFIHVFQRDLAVYAILLKDSDLKLLCYLLAISEYENKLPTIPQDELAKTLGKSRHGILESLKRLEKNGCIRSKKLGKSKTYELDEKLCWRGKARNYPIKDRIKER